MDDDPKVQPQEGAAASSAPGKPVRKRPVKRTKVAPTAAAPEAGEPATPGSPAGEQPTAEPPSLNLSEESATELPGDAPSAKAPGAAPRKRAPRAKAAGANAARASDAAGPTPTPTAEPSGPAAPAKRRPRRAPAVKRATSPSGPPAAQAEDARAGLTPGGLVLPERHHLDLSERVPASAVRVPAAKIALSTASVYPESVASAFEIARRLGYDGIELLVFTDPVSQDPDAVRALSDYYGVPVLSVHSPCLLVTQRVWSTDPWEKLKRSQAAAEQFGASTVVVHPPFRWQRDYGRDFEIGLSRMRDETDVIFAVENMYPWRARNREWAAYLPDWDPRNQDYPHITLDLSHTAVSGTPALAMAADFGDRLAHIHLADGTGLARDEHLIPGRGNQPCAELLEGLAVSGFTGTIVIEVSTRKAANRAEREAELAEALAFARLYLAAPLEPTPS